MKQNGFRINNIILFILLLITICSCSTENEYYNPDSYINANPDYNVINQKSQMIDSIMTCDIVDVHTYDNYLVVLTNTSGALINVYDVMSKKKIISFGNKGNAKNEFMDMFYHSYIKTTHGKTYLYVTQARGTLTKVIDMDKSIKNGTCCIHKLIKHPEAMSSMFSRPFIIDPDSFFNYTDIAYTDIRDKDFKAPTIGIYSRGKYNTKPVFQKTIESNMLNVIMTAYSAKLSISPDNTKFAFALKFIDIVNLVDTKTLSNIGLVNKNSYDFNFLETEVNENNFKESIKLYNIDVCATNDELFVLKSKGVSIKFLNENMGKPYTKYVFVYDWDGNLLNSFSVQEGWSHIAYNKKHNILFGSNDNGYIFSLNYKK